MAGNGSEIASRIKELCATKGIPIGRLESDLELAHSYIRTMDKQGSVPSLERLDKIATYLNVTSEFLVSGVSSFNKQNSGSGVKIPLLEKVYANNPLGDSKYIVGEELISEKLARSGDYIAYVVEDDYMAPLMYKKDRAIVRIDSDVDCYGPDRFVFVSVNGLPAACRMIRQNDESGKWVIPLNSTYSANFYESGDDDFKIIGEVVEIRRTL